MQKKNNTYCHKLFLWNYYNFPRFMFFLFIFHYIFGIMKKFSCFLKFSFSSQIFFYSRTFYHAHYRTMLQRTFPFYMNQCWNNHYKKKLKALIIQFEFNSCFMDLLKHYFVNLKMIKSKHNLHIYVWWFLFLLTIIAT